ncbi:hypothetical protein PybrP1_000365 [[Pythium] brassicae (nom. inval.)]|nr:hypothetical protein PybrP1_000365 [[Pythium] brassicae (nom. inval.)]
MGTTRRAVSSYCGAAPKSGRITVVPAELAASATSSALAWPRSARASVRGRPAGCAKSGASCTRLARQTNAMKQRLSKVMNARDWEKRAAVVSSRPTPAAAVSITNAAGSSGGTCRRRGEWPVFAFARSCCLGFVMPTAKCEGDVARYCTHKYSTTTGDFGIGGFEGAELPYWNSLSTVSAAENCRLVNYSTAARV